ncbi:response regulator [Chloroflexota bacterium]
MADRKILVVEDDATLLEVLKYNLIQEGYNVLTATDGTQAVESAEQNHPDILILDIMLPKMDGLEVCRVIRREMTMPIIMLTAKTEEIDKVVGLEVGADDYMTKPFSMREFLARVKAMLRRMDMIEEKAPTAEQIVAKTIQLDGLEIDLGRHQVSLNGVVLELSRKEYDLLVYLATNLGQVFSRAQLLSKVWGYDYIGDTRTIDVHIRWLRQKIEADTTNPRYLLTVRGVGYKFEG